MLIRCPRCGRRNREEEVFDCQGECGREHLCLRHFDEEYDVCLDCARSLRQEDEKRIAADKATRRELAEWRQRAEKAEGAVAALTQRSQRSESERQQIAAAADSERSDWQAQKKSLNEQMTYWKGRAEKAEGELPGLRRQVESEQSSRAGAESARAKTQREADALAAQLADWKKRAESAEGQLTAIRRQEEEARRQTAEAEARHKAEAGGKGKPIWNQIGLDLISIPAGSFLYGENKTSVHLSAYSISKTPITNAQYKAFMDATKTKAPQHWDGGRIPAGKEQHPVVYVSWAEAVAFCDWAGLRLPNEQEWEKAARGTDGRSYPWGEQAPDGSRCNFNNSVGNTTPVDSFVSGASPYGLLDMAGNVWEWCADWYDSNQQGRVLRGGSFYLNASLVRCAYRNGNYPVGRNNLIGFRVVLPPGF